MAPLELNQARGVWLLLRQRQAQAHGRPGKIVEGLKEDHAPSHLRAILTEAPTLTHQRRQGLAEGEVETLKYTGTDRQPQFLAAFSTATYTREEFLETALVFLFDLWSAILLCCSCLEPTYPSSPVTMHPEDHQSSWPTALLGARRQNPCGCGSRAYAGPR